MTIALAQEAAKYLAFGSAQLFFLTENNNHTTLAEYSDLFFGYFVALHH
ncbi:hypothetical protein [Capnocytophaga catalasegens]|nr:hypothetical protein [Capnocytophaga catalasegens]